MTFARVTVVKEVTQPMGDHTLCFQKVVYCYNDGETEEGFRFIYRDKNGALKAQRGQANLHSFNMIRHMLSNAEKAWGLV